MKDKITILGAGNSGLTMAAFLSKFNYNVCIWNRNIENIADLIENKNIEISGIINGTFSISEVTNDIEKAVLGAKWIFLTMPSNFHKEVIIKFSKYISPETTIILSPGRTFGILEAKKILQKESKNNPIAETQTIIFTCRKINQNKVQLFEMKNDVLLAGTNKEKTEKIINKLPSCLLEYLKPANSYLETSLGNVGMILHCAPLLMNIGWIESPKTKFKYYYDGISPTIATFLQKLDNERLLVAEKLNHNIISLVKWFQTAYNTKADNIFDCLKEVDAYNTIDAPKTLEHRYLYEDISTGLVPLAHIGEQLGLDLKITKLIIELASEVLDYDFRKKGRKINLKDLL